MASRVPKGQPLMWPPRQGGCMRAVEGGPTVISAPCGFKQNHLEGVCVWGAANSSHAHPCLWDVTQADAMTGICKLGLLPPWEVRRSPNSPTRILIPIPTLWALNWKKGILQRTVCYGWGTALLPPRELCIFSPSRSRVLARERIRSLGF